MKILISKRNDSKICIFQNTGKKLRGSFFFEKPEVGDIIMSHCSGDMNFMNKWLVTAILENRDDKIDKNCRFDPLKAYFELAIKNVDQDPAYSNINDSYKLALK